MPESFFDDDPLEGTDPVDESFVPPPPGKNRELWGAGPSKAVNEIFEAETADQAMDSQIDEAESEVERRLEVARYYKMLLHHDTFGADPSPAAHVVQKEVREFVRNRLGVLMGVAAAPDKKQAAYDLFSDQEVAILKQVALLVLAKNEGKTVQKPVEPVFKPVESKTEIPRPQASAPATKPVLKPIQTQVQAQPKPQPQQQTKPAGNAPPAVLAGKIPAEWLSRVLKDHHNDPSLCLRNGKAYIHARDPDGAPIYIYEGATKKKVPYWKDVTLPAVSRTVRPMPMPLAMPGDVNTPFNHNMQAQDAGMLNFAEKKAGALGIMGHMAQAIVHSNLTKDVESKEGNFDVNDQS